MAAPIDIGFSASTSAGAQSGNIGGVTGGGGAIKGYILVVLAVVALVGLWLWKKK